MDMESFIAALEFASDTKAQIIGKSAKAFLKLRFTALDVRMKK